MFIRNLNLEDTTQEEMQTFIREDLEDFGTVTHVSVDPSRSTAIVRFKHISEAESVFQAFQDQKQVLRSPNEKADILYVIPEVSKEDMKRKEAALNN